MTSPTDSELRETIKNLPCNPLRSSGLTLRGVLMVDEVDALMAFIKRESDRARLDEADYMWVNYGNTKDSVEFTNHREELKAELSEGVA